MKIAIPTAEGKLCLHFGHCQKFVFFSIEDNLVKDKQEMEPPPHEPGVLPQWLAENGASIVIAGGMGMRAQSLLQQTNIEVITGAPVAEATQIVNDFLKNNLETGENSCSH